MIETEGAMTRVYEYDVFISYQRGGTNVSGWVRNHFHPLLSELLDDNTDRDMKVFLDDQVIGGTSWPMSLRRALQHARVLVAVCSPKYFRNEWCLAEWHSMALRERRAGLHTPDEPQGLIYPVIFSDSETFPDYATTRRMRDFKQWNVHYSQFQATLEYIDFHREMERICVELVELIERVPEWQADWPVDMPPSEPPPNSRLPRF